MINLQSEKKGYSINLPTKLEEITPELLNVLLQDIKVPDYYCIVAICMNVKLLDIAVNVNNNKEQTVSVVPLLAKIGKEDTLKVNAVVGDKVVVDRSTLERGSHLSIKTVISDTEVKLFISDDEALRKRLLSGGDGSIPEPVKEGELERGIEIKHEKNVVKLAKSPRIFMVSFKIIPATDIMAAIPVKAIQQDPFKVLNKTDIN